MPVPVSHAQSGCTSTFAAEACCPPERLFELIRRVMRSAATTVTVGAQADSATRNVRCKPAAWRAFSSAYAGYWVDYRVAGRGVIPTALALAVDHAFGPGGLHRIEVNIRPENKPSRRVVEKLGFREEAYHQRYMHIDGSWRDHLGYALTSEEIAAEGGLMARWRRVRA